MIQSDESGIERYVSLARSHEVFIRQAVASKASLLLLTLLLFRNTCFIRVHRMALGFTVRDAGQYAKRRRSLRSRSASTDFRRPHERLQFTFAFGRDLCRGKLD